MDTPRATSADFTQIEAVLRNAQRWMQECEADAAKYRKIVIAIIELLQASLVAGHLPSPVLPPLPAQPQMSVDGVFRAQG